MKCFRKKKINFKSFTFVKNEIPGKYKITHVTHIIFLLDITGLDPQSAAPLRPTTLSRPHTVFLKVQKPLIPLPLCLYSCYSMSAAEIVLCIHMLKYHPSLRCSSNVVPFENTFNALPPTFHSTLLVGLKHLFEGQHNPGIQADTIICFVHSRHC